MGAEHSGRLFHFKHSLAHKERCWREWPLNDTGALLKEQNHNFAEQFIDSKWIAK